MKRLATLFFVMSLMFSSLPMNVCYAAEYQENVLDKIVDSFATMGKKGLEKDQILAQRKADRVKRYAEQEAKRIQKEAGKAGKDMKKKLGF
ncbi:MAG: hypothetical protein A3G33_11425 [Omnitrophica bacterium RIFCSPLOWO2_12_FULL_44_17]|uniref:Uncharacterized protein n=1 Tax=Candidatus Danuiimicrobium aquiferis TaxID=1801832 RepID=A0A1G1KRL4_9BACT|nr:MAG: hypothetical protein A3B72_09260 [Omnitrophica bacterium RIFCSPHIGHO2_02_FULL_45_28]OGW91200.1 MAG: hypothetical protein A3E74_02795 [Omnitrophica bacterium RIFCSPHIGHO2_12_FULL_44_12]OGW95600.1 MAG: hypothetical protein A3G33_11425 [Omnitrophica bacterium RIFCSPLOWO2_12_FULL_44_17]